MNKSPVGIFDSGVGGTAVWKAINNILPGESTLYLADSKHAPYGGKTKAEIIGLSVKNTEILLGQGCKLIVVACNTATTAAITYLREHYTVPFIGIEPAIKTAATKTRTKAVGVLATRGTLSSALFHKTSNLYGSGVAVTERVGEGLVSLIEQGIVNGPEIRCLLTAYLNPMLNNHIDHLVLGCTHYTYLIPELLNILPDSVSIVDSGAAVALQTKAILEQNGLLNTTDSPVTHRFYTNLDVQLLSRFLSDVRIKTTIDYMDF